MPPPKQLAAHAFKPGWKGGPGRPLGKRNYLTEVALAALGANFAEHGEETIEQVRREKPHVYLQVVASLLPKQVQTERVSLFSDISDEELAQIEELLTGLRARTVRKLEQYNGAAQQD